MSQQIDLSAGIAENCISILPSIVGGLKFLANGCPHHPKEGSHELVQAAKAAEAALMWLEAEMQRGTGSPIDQITQAFSAKQ